LNKCVFVPNKIPNMLIAIFVPIFKFTYISGLLHICYPVFVCFFEKHSFLFVNN